jgi:hypothetical protein
MLFASLIVSAILLVLFTLYYPLALRERLRQSPRGGVGVALQLGGAVVLVLILGLCFVSRTPVIAWCVLLLTLAMCLCTMARASTFSFVKVSLAVTAGTYLVWCLISLRGLRAGEEWQARYPFESMASRLSYEEAKSRPPRFDEARLADIERQPALDTEYSGRTYMLQRIHRTAVERFIDSPGFGNARNAALERPERVERETRRDYLQDRPADDGPAAPPGDTPPAPASERVPADAPLLTALERSHRGTVLDFVDAPGFGYFRDREHVAGFRPHGLHERPYVFYGPPLEVTRLELVSLLKFDEPRVYVLPGSFPRMNRLGDGTTRSLDAFEDRALAALQGGEDLVAETAGDQVRLLGSVRAVKQCLACHGVSRGELLGAFTYHLRQAGSSP